MTNYTRGSKWRKWDLQIHTPFSILNNGFGDPSKENIWDNYVKTVFKKAIEKNIAVIGITDYFSLDGYEKIKNEYLNNESKVKTLFTNVEMEKIKRILILPNIEFRLNKFVGEDSINFHVIFSDKIPINDIKENFLHEINFVYEGNPQSQDEKWKLKIENLRKLGEKLKSEHPNFRNKNDLFVGMANAVVDDSQVLEVLSAKPSIFKGKFLILLPTDEDLSEVDWNSRDHNARKVLIQKSDILFSSNENTREWALGYKHDKIGDFINEFKSSKPCTWSSDAHSFDKLFEPNLRRHTWVKADPTFEGLKQIIYEPESGERVKISPVEERVKISPVEPDRKNGYKVISKIWFSNTSDFPKEIKFNRNLCSIIGSRSSGKSALLAYIAHSVDKKLVEDMVKGPGEGADYHWGKIELEHSIEWGNGQSNDESPGKIVYIPQNYLFKESKNSDKIKEKIKPVLFKVLPDYKIRYEQSVNNIGLHNQQISVQIDNWFDLSDAIKLIDERLKDLGNKKAIEKEKEETKSKIDYLKKKYQLSNEDLNQYQEITDFLLQYTSRTDVINMELSQISDVSEKQHFFSALKIALTPALANLPKGLQDIIRKNLEKTERRILKKVNKWVVDYKNSIEKDKKEAEENILRTNKKNKGLIEKYQKNIELKELLNKLNEYKGIIKNIDYTEKEKRNIQKKLKEYGKTIGTEIEKRQSILSRLKNYLDAKDQSIIKDIKFGIECGLNRNDIEKVAKKVNLRDNTNFVKKNKFDIELTRKQPARFLQAVYSEKQKINIGNEKKEVAKEILMLTENILFTAEMEGDKIGGFSESTMTPGNIVPFLKKKKKERQIIMVSHNANLVIGSDSEQIIVANRHGTDRKNADGKQFNYFTGSLEYSKTKDKDCNDTLKSQGVREHACDILDGGKIAFEQRKNKYNIK